MPLPANRSSPVYDALDFNHALAVFLNSYSGASAYAIRKGMLDIGVEDNSVVIFSDMMDSSSLFLTANADTIYYFTVLDLTKGHVECLVALLSHSLRLLVLGGSWLPGRP